MFARSLLVLFLLATVGGVASAEPLPRFTEAREAAALHFVKKHCPELTPLLEQLKKDHRTAYEQQIRETFQITELLADLQEDPKLHDLELKIWKAENKAMVLIAQLASAKGDARKPIEEHLKASAKELVDLEVQSQAHRIEVLERELASARSQLTKSREITARKVKERYERFLEKAKRKGTP